MWSAFYFDLFNCINYSCYIIHHVKFVAWSPLHELWEAQVSEDPFMHSRESHQVQQFSYRLFIWQTNQKYMQHFQWNANLKGKRYTSQKEWNSLPNSSVYFHAESMAIQRCHWKNQCATIQCGFFFSLHQKIGIPKTFLEKQQAKLIKMFCTDNKNNTKTWSFSKNLQETKIWIK